MHVTYSRKKKKEKINIDSVFLCAKKPEGSGWDRGKGRVLE